MDITAILGQIGGLQSMAKELGISEAQAASGAAALAPAILGGFKKQAQEAPGGLAGLAGIIGALGGGALLESVLSPEPTDVAQGNSVLGQIFGSKDVSRAVAQNAAATSGLDAGILKKMLPMLAMAVAGYMAKQAGGAAGTASGGGGVLGGLGGLIGGMLGGGSAPAAAAPASAGGGLASMIDMNGDGNALDDIMRMAGKLMK